MFTKLIISGNLFEFVQYEKQPKNKRLKLPFNYSLSSDEYLREYADSLEKKYNGYYSYINSLNSKRKFIRIVNCNCSSNDKFLTLTFKDNITNVRDANKLFTLFVKRLKSYIKGIIPDIKYAVVIEFQDGARNIKRKVCKTPRAVIHYHVLLFDFPFLHFSVYNSLWRYGSLHIRTCEINNSDNVGLYLSKYMSKNILISDFRLSGKKKFFTSHNLNKPIILNDVNLSDYSNLNCFYKKSFENYFTGRINVFSCLKNINPNFVNDKRHFIKLGYGIT